MSEGPTLAIVSYVSPNSPWMSIHEAGQLQTWFQEKELRSNSKITLFRLTGKKPKRFITFLHDLTILVKWGWGKEFQKVPWVDKRGLAFKIYQTTIGKFGKCTIPIIIFLRFLMSFFLNIILPLYFSSLKKRTTQIDSGALNTNLTHNILSTPELYREAIKFLTKNDNYDFIVFTTASAYVDPNKIYIFLKKYNNKFDIAGKKVNIGNDYFPSGFFLIFSKNAYIEFLKQKFMPLYTIHDVYLEKWLKKNKFRFLEIKYSIYTNDSYSMCYLCKNDDVLSLKCEDKANRLNEITLLIKCHLLHKDCQYPQM